MGSLTNRTFAIAFGAVYVLIGLVGFAVTGGVGFAESQGKDLILFELNPLHNLVHLAVGGMFLVGASLGERTARGFNALIGATYLLVGAVGLFMTGSTSNLLALNHPDNILHLGSAAAALYVASRKPAPLHARS